jgi:hypothetical protein
MLDKTHSKKSQNQNPTKSRNSTESPELCQISRIGDILKGLFLQKRIKKNVNKGSDTYDVIIRGGKGDS